MSILQQPFLLHETHEANLEKKWMVPMLVVYKRERKIRLSTFVYAVQCRRAPFGCASTRRDFKLLSVHTLFVNRQRTHQCAISIIDRYMIAMNNYSARYLRK